MALILALKLLLGAIYGLKQFLPRIKNEKIDISIKGFIKRFIQYNITGILVECALCKLTVQLTV
jgi:hypothetical protein